MKAFYILLIALFSVMAKPTDKLKCKSFKDGKMIEYEIDDEIVSEVHDRVFAQVHYIMKCIAGIYGYYMGPVACVIEDNGTHRVQFGKYYLTSDSTEGRP